ncbi:hypothetical protein G4H71_13540 [Rhodococcus triatomae]|uniref:Uncharacterized protein n=1 Tax=Rhodococcus triatomae TaxID=300028 RepID=A0A1G8PST0_9NOCA|nr:hypothetical protein [Rhodococcus triatomae]QNG20174.1 hypothetical protein G4H72_16835 [Rhodococcus triatomae]QNG23910.1 hypothetical protein G4H71_13540 [Rhodococcus triatomae]SDI94910.1 hypothetical protein SAMN05444695_113112 [Rhodococcus triatomae]
MSARPLPLADRINRLFAVAHERGGAEPDVDAVAHGVSERLGRQVSGEMLRTLRDGTDTADRALLAALADHFSCPAEYLLDENPRHFDLLLRFEIAVRDADVRHLSMRTAGSPGVATDEELERMIGLLETLPHAGSVDHEH